MSKMLQRSELNTPPSGASAPALPVTPRVREAEKLSHLYRENRDWMCRLAAVRLGTWDEAEDLVHDTFATLVGTPHLDSGHIRATLAITLNRKVLDKHRRWGLFRRKVMPRLEVLETHRTSDTPHQQLAVRQTLQKLDATLRTLQPQLVEVFLMNHVAGLTLAEIALAQGRPLSTIKTWYGQVKHALMEHLEVLEAP